MLWNGDLWAARSSIPYSRAPQQWPEGEGTSPVTNQRSILWLELKVPTINWNSTISFHLKVSYFAKLLHYINYFNSGLILVHQKHAVINNLKVDKSSKCKLKTCQQKSSFAHRLLPIISCKTVRRRHSSCVASENWQAKLEKVQRREGQNKQRYRKRLSGNIVFMLNFK